MFVRMSSNRIWPVAIPCRALLQTGCKVNVSGLTERCGTHTHNRQKKSITYFGMRSSGVGLESMPCSLWLPSWEAGGGVAGGQGEGEGKVRLALGHTWVLVMRRYSSPRG